MDGNEMAENVHQLRPKPPDSEKVTINLGYVDLGHIDLMVQEGFTRTGPISFEPQSVTNSNATPTWSRNLHSERASTSVCGTTAAKISKQRV